jgi:hypothetical protein
VYYTIGAVTFKRNTIVPCCRTAVQALLPIILPSIVLHVSNVARREPVAVRVIRNIAAVEKSIAVQYIKNSSCVRRHLYARALKLEQGIPV